MKRTTPVLLVLVAVVLGAAVALSVGCSDHAERSGTYQCPMHPTYLSDRPGDCPICGMRLVKIGDRGPGTGDRAPTHPEAESPAAYVCPMGCPDGKSDKPGTCPECGMPLVEAGDRGPGTGDRAPTHPEAESHAAYVCPMACPGGKSDKPGTCPECGMKLVPAGKTAPSEPGEAAPHPEGHVSKAAAPAQGERKLLYYRNPMDPTVTSPVPMKDSMGMDYVPVYAEQPSAAPAAGIPGKATVEITSEGLRLAGVQTAPAVTERLARSVRTVGTVTADETRIRHVHTKVPGWVERLFVNFTGQLVRKGEPILSIYSQELVASQEEYLKAREAAARFASSALPEVRRGGDDLAKAARRRLELFDVPAAFIDELERTGTVRRTVTLDAAVSGYVTVKNVFEGQRVEPATELFTIVDLSRVWVEADFYEYEATLLRLGEEAAVALPYDPTTRLVGRIAVIDPTLDADTRTLRVRFEFPNPGMKLKPGMFADIELAAEAVEGIVIPDSALMDTGKRQVVFVAKGKGTFEPREVTVGIRAAGKALIISGVAAGEQVVIRANFLLDSESRLRAALSAPAPAPGTGDKAQGTGASNHVH